ncbi:uncharacterized protein METZ01_LOCUS279396, partial [marine metagenome]
MEAMKTDENIANRALRIPEATGRSFLTACDL